MTERQYQAMSRAAYAVRKLKDGKLAVLTPRDLELAKQLLKDKDRYVEQAVAHKRTALQAEQDVGRCEWAVNKLTVSGPVSPATAAVDPLTCKHGVSGPWEDPCPQCSAEYGYAVTVCG